MNAPRQKNVIHSADVRIQLLVKDQVLAVAQLGPDFLILRHPADHPPAAGELFVSIDGLEKRWPVYLADGIKITERKTRITDLVIPK